MRVTGSNMKKGLWLNLAAIMGIAFLRFCPAVQAVTHVVLDLGTGVNLELVAVPAGSFTMGDTSRDPADPNNPSPSHTVAFPTGFHMGKFEFTQAQWMKIMGAEPARPDQPDASGLLDVCANSLGAGGGGAKKISGFKIQGNRPCRLDDFVVTTGGFAYGEPPFGVLFQIR